jgi:hypothetical protein
MLCGTPKQKSRFGIEKRCDTIKKEGKTKPLAWG